jgi:hypothetical protein
MEQSRMQVYHWRNVIFGREIIGGMSFMVETLIVKKRKS